MLDVVYGAIRNEFAAENLIACLSRITSIKNDDSTLFLGYPLSAKVEESITVDALLLTKNKGIIAFIFHEKGDDDKEKQDKLYYDLDYTFSKYESLRKGRKLAFNPVVMTFFCDKNLSEGEKEYIFVNDKNLEEKYLECDEFDNNLYPLLCESLYKISSMKPKKRRANVKKEDSKGAKIKYIEKSIANLDEWQKKAAYEVPDGPQQIRGLAGSGKTVVLALKAAYLHSQYPEWNILVTFYTRALKQQYFKLIKNFMTDFSDTPPDWSKLRVVHAWGTNNEPGVYSIAAEQVNIIPYDYVAAKQKFTEKYAFQGICEELLNVAQDKFIEQYDAILIDEAQDLPSEFFKLCYNIATKEKRVIFAYDELQNLNNLEPISVEKMFGCDAEGQPLVKLSNEKGKPRQDIVLPICYRNTKWALTIAHALGFGIYRSGGMIQAFSTPSIWRDIGYEVVSGRLEKGRKVVLKRDEKSTPQYFKSLIKPEDAFQALNFTTETEQYIWLSREIKRNIEEEELDPDDILVVFPDAYYAQSSYNILKRFLAQQSIESILSGVTTGRDTIKIEGAISCASIFRAKGNEFPFVYVVNAHECYKSSNIALWRNILFTAITRARAWVRVCGVGTQMEELKKEITICIDKDYKLEFKNPTDKELNEMRSLFRSLSRETSELINSSEQQLMKLADLLKKGEINKEDLQRISELFNSLDTKL